MTIDRALSGDPFRIDQILCREAARGLSSYVSVNQPEPWSSLPVLSQFVFKALFIAICHQFNWDFLQNAMAGWLLPTPEAKLIDLQTVRPSDISKLLQGYAKPERIRPQQRAQMLRATAFHLAEMLADGSLQRLVAVGQLDGPKGFYATMKRIPAFAEDALEKKVRVLAHDLYRENIIRFSDPSNLKPAVEYHLLRLYLRSGRVYPVDRSVTEALRHPNLSSRARLVTLLRLRVEEAMNFTSYYSGLDMATLNYVEWQIGRSICIPDPPPLCIEPPQGELPADINAICASACTFVGFCRARNQPTYGWFHEPQFQKAIY
jgi:hypothetical protein